jgi:hypothetical protein
MQYNVVLHSSWCEVQFEASAPLSALSSTDPRHDLPFFLDVSCTNARCEEQCEASAPLSVLSINCNLVQCYLVQCYLVQCYLVHYLSSAPSSALLSTDPRHDLPFF